MNKPIWIGVEVTCGNGTIKICIGLNQEDGHEVSYITSDDDDWTFNGTITVKEDFVFDNNNNIIL